jgi:hypothetical protein
VARRRRLEREGLPPEAKRQPATTLDPSRRPESIAEAIWRFRAARTNRATGAPSPLKYLPIMAVNGQVIDIKPDTIRQGAVRVSSIPGR